MENKQTKKYSKVIIPFEKITSNNKSIFIHQGRLMIAVSKAYLRKVLESDSSTHEEQTENSQQEPA